MLTGRRPVRRLAAVGIRAVVTAVVAVIVLVLVTACGGSDPPDASTGLTGIAEAFLAPGADVAALYTALRPTEADYAEVFRLDTAADARTHYAGYWQHARPVGPAPGQTEYRVQSVTTEELVAGTGASAQFAGGFRVVAPQLAPGLRIYDIVFHKPGQSLGIHLDGLVYVNGAWRVVPAPWSVLAVDEPGHQH